MNIDEGKSEVKKEDEGTRRLLRGFTQANIKIHLLTDEIDKLYSKQKYQNLFDIGVLSIYSTGKIDEYLSILFKKGAKIHVESADMVVPLSKEQRAEFRKKVDEKCEKAGWQLLANPPYTHHMLYQVDKDDTETIKSTAVTTDDDLTLDDLML